MGRGSRPILTGVFPGKRLFSLLDQRRRRPAIWVSGSPGSGKTTAVIGYLDARNLPCLWYQVDPGEADPATFFYYPGLAAKNAGPASASPYPCWPGNTCRASPPLPCAFLKSFLPA